MSWPRLKRRHHFLPYIIFYMFMQWLHPNGKFSKFLKFQNYLKLQVMNYVISSAYNFFIFHPNRKHSIIIVWFLFFFSPWCINLINQNWFYLSKCHLNGWKKINSLISDVSNGHNFYYKLLFLLYISKPFQWSKKGPIWTRFM